MQAADVDPVLGQQRQDGGASGGVRRHIAVHAADQQLAEVALPGGVRHPQRDAQRGRRERGQAVRVDAGGVLGEDQTVDAGRERTGQLGHTGPQPVEFVEDFGLGRHQ
ncbi:hypothetical protein SAV14893_028270 [Streptomyces avermitilis]|uniref:Uncharacterized protein n=1 Tax=Streptomyces avermitilis TaxID=33903 RepID=A0A4D4LSE5_STRAX|nr:hypothetical protein SAV14893_028270 [Streptomyces avermitilis]